MTESKIFVSDLGLGKDLLNYIGKANIEIMELPDGIDIQILLGTMAEQQVKTEENAKIRVDKIKLENQGAKG